MARLQMHDTQSPPVISLELLQRFDVTGPRYTSYPTADRFVEAFNAPTYSGWLRKRVLAGQPRPLSLYVHLPFCGTICYYCACNKVITRDHGRSARYVRYVRKEIDLLGEALDGARNVVQMHWGGGTPNFLHADEMTDLAHAVSRTFRLDSKGEYSIELDPRSVQADTHSFACQPGLQPHERRCAGFRPRRAACGQPHSDRRADLRHHRGGSRRGFQVDQYRSHLWTAQAKRDRLQRHAGQGDPGFSGAGGTIQLCASARCFQTAAADRRGGPADAGREAAVVVAGDSTAQRRRLPLCWHGSLCEAG